MSRLVLLLLACCPYSLLACELADAERRPVDDDLVVYFRFEPAAPAPAQLFSMRFRICSGADIASVENFQVDARMPAHNHGMNYRPAVAELDNGLLQASGLMFHMPGLWQVEVDFLYRQRQRTLAIEYRL